MSAKRTTRVPSGPASSESTAALDTVVSSAGTWSVMAKTALQSGSSQHGKARRASVASNWVVAMTCSSPASSLNVDR